MGKAIDKLKNIKIVRVLKNIWSVEDLRQRILITLLFVAIYRFGSFVVLPGVDTAQLEELSTQTKTGLLSLLDMFSGGAFSKASIFALGIMPYISASIVMQLLGIAVPYFQKMQREGESGRRKMNQYTRYLTVLILLFQAPAYLINLRMQTNGQALSPGLSWTMFLITSTIILAAGSMFILWLGERITDKGIGNGVSLIIMVGIIARFPQAVTQEFVSRLGAAQGGLVMFLPPRSSGFACSDCSRSASGTRHPQGARSVRQTCCRQPSGCGRRSSVHPPEALCCQCDAYHLRAGNHVHTHHFRRFHGRWKLQFNTSETGGHPEWTLQRDLRCFDYPLHLSLHGYHHQPCSDG